MGVGRGRVASRLGRVRRLRNERGHRRSSRQSRGISAGSISSWYSHGHSGYYIKCFRVCRASRTLRDSNDSNPSTSSQQSFTRLLSPPSRSKNLDVSPQCRCESLGILLLQLVPLLLCLLNDNRSCTLANQYSLRRRREENSPAKRISIDSRERPDDSG